MKNRFFVPVLCAGLLCLVLAASGVQAQTYYVSPSGSDSASGLAGSPWQTLQHAVSNVIAGDVVLVQSGTYAGCRIQRSGSAEAYITLRAADDASVLINQPGPENRHQSGIELETWDGDGTVAYWVIQGLEVANIPGWGIDIRGNADHHSHHISVLSNQVHHCGLERGSTGIFCAFVDDVLIEGNSSYSNGEHGVYTSNSGDRPVIRNNRLYDNVGCGLHMNGDVEMGGDGIISGALVEGNVIYGNGSQGGSAINNDGVTDSVFRNNLLYDNHAGGFAVFQENGAVCSQNNQYLNNTVVQAADGRWAFNISQAGCTGNKIFNNILYINHAWRGAITMPASSLSGFESDYNVVVNRFSVDGDESIIDLAAWRALGFGAHSILATPDQLFVNAAGGDYRLRADSPAVDAGRTLSAVTSDIVGTARPTGAAYDIGAYEYTTGGSSGGGGGNGRITYALPDGTVYRINAEAGAQPENISQALDALSPRKTDEWLNVSPDGQWLLLSTERFDAECNGWACLALAAGDLSSGGVVRAAGALVRPEGFAAVASGGALIVYPAAGGPHALDLYAIRKNGSDWDAPVLLTGSSSYAYHELPAISADGTRVVFNANMQPYAQEGTVVAQVGVDGQGFQVLASPDSPPAGLSAGGALRQPDFAPDGSLVFEGDWDGERIWRLPAGASTPVEVGNQFHNDNSPCVLPNGRVASLWMDRPGSPGVHELKVMNADGGGYDMLVTDTDIADVGLGCGQ